MASDRERRSRSPPAPNLGGCASTAAEISLDIISLSGVQLASMTLPASAHVREVKQRLVQATGLPPLRQQLVYEDRVLDTAEPLSTLGPKKIARLTFVARKRLLLTASEDHVARLWCAESGDCLRSFMGHKETVNMAVLSPDGLSVLTASEDCVGMLWKTESGELTRCFLGHDAALVSAAFSHDGLLVVTASENGWVKLWKRYGRAGATSACIRSLRTSPGEQWSAVFAPDNKHVLVAASDSIARLWDIQRGRLRQSFVGHSGGVLSANFAPACDGSEEQVLTGSADRAAKLWSALSGECRVTFSGHKSTVSWAAFSADAAVILTASADRTARRWAPETGECLSCFAAPAGTAVWFVAFCPEDTSLVVSGSHDGTARLWYAEVGECAQHFLGHGGPVVWATLTP